MADRVGPPVMHKMAVDHPTTRAGLQPAGQLHHGDELVVLVEGGVDQVELGQGKQQLAPPLDMGRLEQASGFGPSDG